MDPLSQALKVMPEVPTSPLHKDPDNCGQLCTTTVDNWITGDAFGAVGVDLHFRIRLLPTMTVLFGSMIVTLLHISSMWTTVDNSTTVDNCARQLCTTTVHNNCAQQLWTTRQLWMFLELWAYIVAMLFDFIAVTAIAY
jgi:hypothetical protein